ncbi:MAG: hypothetical protein AMJ79_07875, partial [Phycisphaerae bacterium SM23_30]
LLVGGIFTTFCAAQRSSRAIDSDSAQPQQQREKPIEASLYYSNVEPKQLFDILQKTFHVQFEGIDTVTGPLTLISSGGKMVDLRGMLQMLDKVLQAQGKKTSRDGQVIRIELRSATENKFIPLENVKSAEVDKIVKILKSRFMPETTEVITKEAVRATDIIAHPTQSGILVSGPEEVFRLIEDYLRKTSIYPTPSRPSELLAPGEEPPIMRDYIALEFMDPQEFQQLLESDETLKGKFTSGVYRNSLAIYSRDVEVFEKIRQMKEIFDIDRMEIRYFPLSYAQAHTVQDPKTKVIQVKGLADLIGEIYPKEAVELPPEVQQARRELTYPEQAPEGDTAEMVEEAMTRAGVIDEGVAGRMSRALSVIATGNDELVIVPDPERNGLLVRTFSRNIPKIQALIDVLDRPRDQVFIEVYITEVSHDDLTELGVDWTLMHNEGVNTLRQSIPATASKLPGGDFPSVLTYELISDNFSAFLRALQQTGKVDVISRPSVTTKDNAVAIFELGDKVPTVSKIRVSPEGLSSQSDVDYKDITNRLEVRPFIHPDDYVTLDIIQKLDEISARTVQISENFFPQIFITRKAETTVRIKDGQTICLGGFVSDKIVENETRIPLLGAIPILGELFKFSKRQRIKTELIIFITPHILKTPTELLRMTNEQRRKSVLDPRERRGEIIEPERTLHYPPFRDPIRNPLLPDDGTIIPAPKTDTNNPIKQQTEIESKPENPLSRLQSVKPDKIKNPNKDQNQDKTNADPDKTQDKSGT